MKTIKVYIDPRSTINYSSYYVLGLYDFFGKKNVHFSAKYFHDLYEIDMLMAFVLVDNGQIKKIIIDYRDQDDIIEEAYHWSNTYAKINVSESTLRDNRPKLINIPSSFCIRFWNLFELAFHLCKNFFDARIFSNRNNPNIHIRPEVWIRNYLRLIRRQSLKSYNKKETQHRKSNYVFFASTLWQRAENVDTFRKQYILCCAQNQDIKFEGGFVMQKNAEIPMDIPSNLLLKSYFSNKVYLKKINESAFVFNTPAVFNCHGWKLGEFLCMGKAIISTPLVNKTPMPLEHGKNIYFINKEEELEDAIELLLKDEKLRENLEENAKTCYEKYVSPVKVIESIFTYSLNNVSL